MLAVVILVICDAANYRIKGEPVNIYFWKVLSITNVQSYLLSFPQLLLLCGVVIFTPLYSSVITLRRNWKCSKKICGLFIILLSVIAVVGESSPKHVLQSYLRYTKAKKIINELSVLPDSFIKYNDLTVTAGKNIVWIYVESLNKAMLDESQFPDLMPSLKTAADEGIFFELLEQMPGQQQSLDGILNTQCGRMHGFNITPDYNICLGHILNRAGYNQVFLKGAPLTFQYFGKYFRSWNYDEVLGQNEITDAYPEYDTQKNFNKGWGYHDRIIFDLAYKKYIELSQKGEPFHLALFTLDTHEGKVDLETYKKSPPYTGPGKDNNMVKAFRCFDILFLEFMDKISKLPAFENTIVVVVGDHIMHETLVYIKDDPLKIFGAILNTGKKMKIQEPATLMDFAPTILSLADIETNAMFLDGRDLFGNKMPARHIDFSQLSDEVKRELGMQKPPPKNNEYGVIYKHSAMDFYNFVQEDQVAFKELSGVRAYYKETQSYLYNNILVLLESKDCNSLSGKPYMHFLNHDSNEFSLDFSRYPQAQSLMLEDRCIRLLSGFVATNVEVNKLWVSLDTLRENSSGWQIEFD
jgi:hypothetical protein